MPTAVYPGSLDPVTFGHTAAIADAAEAFGELIVAIGVNPAKNYLFSLAEREALTRQATAHIPGVRVTSFSGLLVHYLVRRGLNIVVRGLRNGQDFDDALLQDSLGWQQNLAKGIKALYVPARTGQRFISSTALKAVLKDQGLAVDMAPLSTIQATQARMLGQYLYGVTGTSGAGKSYICQKFGEIAKRRNMALTHIDLDKIAHEILENAEEPLYQKARSEVVFAFGDSVLNTDGSINRKALGQIVFGDPEKLSRLNEILHEPIFFNLNDRLRGKSGIFLVDAALLAESARTHIMNNNILLVDAPVASRAKRLEERDNLTAEQVEKRAYSQYSAPVKMEIIQAAIAESHHGNLDKFFNEDNLLDDVFEAQFDVMLSRIDIYGELRIGGFLRDLGVLDFKGAYETLRKLYSGNDRLYHSLAHIVDGLDKIPAFRHEVADIRGFGLGWLFHNAFYDVTVADCGRRSAEMGGALCEGWGIDPEVIKSAQRFIEASVPETEDEKYFVDLDMSILGAEAEVYARYEDNVRREYAGIPQAQWRKGRAEFLRGLGGFATEHFRTRYGAFAEVNVRGSLARLEAGSER